MPNAHTIRLLVIAAAVQLGTGVGLYASPNTFAPHIYAAVSYVFPYLAAALLSGGLLLLLLVRYSPQPALRRLLAIGAATPLFFIAWYIAIVNGYSGTLSYLFLGVSVLAAVWLPQMDTARGREFNLFAATLGPIQIALGLLILGWPGLLHSPAYDPIRPLLPLLGLLSMALGGLLLSPALLQRLPLSIRRVAGAIVPAILCITFLISGAWTGVLMWGLWAIGSLLDSHRALTHLGQTEASRGDLCDDTWAAQTERTVETWSWLLTLLVVFITTLMGPSVANMMHRAFLFVMLLGGYNIIACWLLPPLGTPRQRLCLHLLVLAIAICTLITNVNPIAGALLPVLLAIPMVSARAAGRAAGFCMLAAVLTVLALSNLLDIWLEGVPANQVFTSLAIKLLTLGVTGAMAVIASANQRRIFNELNQSSRDLANKNQELLAQSEALAFQQAALAFQRDELQESELRFRTAFEGAPIGMAMVSLDSRVMKANLALSDMLGYAPGELVGRRIESMTHPDDHAESQRRIAAVVEGRSDGFQVEKRYVHRDGRLVWTSVSVGVVRDSHGDPLYLLTQTVDITERRHTEEELLQLANYDPLTGLINRRYFQQTVELRLALADLEGHRGAMLFLDLDQFKFVNDTLGHHAGDELLKGLARVLTATVGDRGIVSRLGGDEFAMLLPRVDAAQCEIIASEILMAVRAHIDVVGGQPVGMTASIGIALYPEHGRSVKALMLHADLAMYQAKESGRNRYRIYVSGDREAEMGSRLNWERRLREALAEDRFTLHFQPILDLRSGQIRQYEALLRMVEHDGTLILPRQFLGVAESYGLIHAIDRWVVRRAIHTIAEEQRNGRRLSLSVNLSARAFSDPDLLPLIQAQLLEHQVAPGTLQFEITETAAVADMATATAFIETLTGLGCRFSLDDFGAGFSSLVYLKRLPVSCLKIDGSFIERLPHEPVDQKMVKAVVNLARELEMETVAEYVGCDATLALLREMGVDAGQGFHIGRPGPLPKP